MKTKHMESKIKTQKIKKGSINPNSQLKNKSDKTVEKT